MPKKEQIELLKSELLIMKGDLRNVFYKLDDLFQKLINLNQKINQHIKEGHIPNGKTISDTGVSNCAVSIGGNSPDAV
tara:strand:- start:126 stop:359 length:234 start_codon:yes stop_codon:yes gene_type:complete